MFNRIPGMLYEAVAESVGAAGGVEPAAEPAGDLGGEGAPESLGTPEPAAAPINYGELFGTPEGQQALREALYEQQLEGAYEQPQYGEPEPYDPIGDFDFLADDAPQQFARILEENNQRMLEAIQGSPALVAAEQQHQETWANNQFGTIEKELGAPIPENLREMAITLAAGQRPPDGHPGLAYFDPTRALKESATMLHSLVQEQRADAVRAYQAGVTGEGGAGGLEPPAGGAGAIHSEAQPSNMREAREAWERRQGLR